MTVLQKSAKTFPPPVGFTELWGKKSCVRWTYRKSEGVYFREKVLLSYLLLKKKCYFSWPYCRSTCGLFFRIPQLSCSKPTATNVHSRYGMRSLLSLKRSVFTSWPRSARVNILQTLTLSETAHHGSTSINGVECHIGCGGF